jgi:hypothetical protein
MNIDWSKAPEGATHGRKTYAGFDWYKVVDGNFCCSSRHGHWEPAVTSMSMCEIRPIATEWMGEGLPPVGTVCEINYAEEWMRCEVIYHFNARAEMVAAAIVDIGDVRTVTQAIAECFRPIRTAEQIAADERLHKIRNAMTRINKLVLLPGDTVRANIALAVVEAMIDAGYTAQVMP